MVKLGKTIYLMNLSEFARIYGIEFSDVLSRGSQFRVESMMFRLATPENYVMISPSRQQAIDIFNNLTRWRI